MRTLTATLLVLILFCLSACNGGEGLLSYQAEEQTLSLSFEKGGVPCTASLWMGPGGEERDFCLTYTSPAALAGLTVSRKDGAHLCTQGEQSIPLPSLPEGFSPVSLFCIPSSARVRSVESEGDDRVATLSQGDTVYTLRFRAGAELPYYISRAEGDTLRAVTILEKAP